MHTDTSLVGLNKKSAVKEEFDDPYDANPYRLDAN